MSSMTSKKLIMLELDIIASVDWKPEFGKKLKLMRGKVSRRALAQKVIDQYNYKVSQQYIQLLEHPEGNEKAPEERILQTAKISNRSTKHQCLRFVWLTRNIC
jgi:hypothetical protein